MLERYGTVKINLAKLIEKNDKSKNKLSHRAEMQRTQINHYCNNEVTRLDIDVLARLCTVLECEIGDLLEFVPPDSTRGLYKVHIIIDHLWPKVHIKSVCFSGSG